MKTKVGILGGSFNPVHKGHIRIAELVLKHKLVSKVWLLPCFGHYFNKLLTTPEHRLSMLYKSIKGKKNIEVCAYEIENESDGKMYHTILDLQADYPNIEFYIIIGMDNAINIVDWYNYSELINKVVPFIVIQRVGYYCFEDHYWFNKSPHILLKDKMTTEYSSTLAREAIKNKDNNVQEKLMDRSVIDYIKRNGLYNENNN